MVKANDSAKHPVMHRTPSKQRITLSKKSTMPRLRKPALRTYRRYRVRPMCEGKTDYLKPSKVSGRSRGWDNIRSTWVSLTVNAMEFLGVENIWKGDWVPRIILVSLRNIRFYCLATPVNRTLPGFCES